MTTVWERSRQKGAALLLMLAIADFASDDGGNAFPSVATLAKKTRMSDRQVQRLIQQCEKSGELVAERSTDGRRSTVYTVVLSALRVTPDNLSPVTKGARTGDIATSPEPSSLEPSEAEYLWREILERAEMNDRNRRLLASYPVHLDGPTLVVQGDRKWARYVERASPRPVRWVAG